MDGKELEMGRWRENMMKDREEMGGMEGQGDGGIRGHGLGEQIDEEMEGKRKHRTQRRIDGVMEKIWDMGIKGRETEMQLL